MIAWDAPAAEIGNSPTAMSQKCLRKTLLVTLVSSMASGNSLSVWRSLSRPWTNRGPKTGDVSGHG